MLQVGVLELEAVVDLAPLSAFVTPKPRA
jgi:hypothetical protein